jgi:hypothetical protein
MGKFDAKYQQQIDMMLEYRKQYEDEITEGEHLIVQNRVRESYLYQVNYKIAILKRERDAMNNAKSGMELAMLLTTFNGHSPLSWGRDGNESRVSFKTEPLPLYKEVLQINIDIVNDFNAKITQEPVYSIYYDENGETKQRFKRVSNYLVGRIKESDIHNFDYDNLKKLLYAHIHPYLRNDSSMEVFHSIIPYYNSNSYDLRNSFHEWWFPLSCSITAN